jgi:hypothetical protein
MNQGSGNGSGEFNIDQADMGGWVRVFPSRLSDLPDDLPALLSRTLAEWFRRRPELRLKCILPVSRCGETVELHAWYDRHGFSPLQNPVPQG